MEILITRKRLLLDRNLSRLLANLTVVGSLNCFCSAATLITRDVKRLCPCTGGNSYLSSKERFDLTRCFS